MPSSARVAGTTERDARRITEDKARRLMSFSNRPGGGRGFYPGAVAET
jgi:hypothetical protein